MNELNWEKLESDLQKILNSRGGINPQILIREPHLIDYINESLPNFETLQQRKWAIQNRQFEPPKCYCGNSTTWLDTFRKYRIYCSLKCANNSEEKKRNCENTMIERYGVTNPMLVDEFSNKVKQTNLEKYGVEYCQQNKEVREKGEKTNLERYGTKYIFQSKKIKEKIKKINIERYDTEYYSQSETSKLLKKKNFIQNVLPIKIKQLEEQNIFPYEWNLEDYVNTKTKYQFIHSDCERVFTSFFGNGYIIRCPKCHVLHGTSKIERHLQETLIQILGNKRVECNNRELIKPKELDIVLDGKLAIEVNGSYWHSEEQEEENGKVSLLEKSNLSPIQVLHFWDFELEEKFDICISMILAKLNEFQNRIQARKCILKELNTDETNKFLEENHLQGSTNAKYKYGLFFNEELIQVITLSKPRFNKNVDLEIHRIATKLNTTVIGGIQKLFKHVLNQHKGSTIISYADKRYSNGDIYKRLNFEEQKDSQPNYFWTNGIEFLTRYQTQKHKLEKKLEFFDINFSESENMQLNGFWKIKDCGNKTFTINIK